MKKIIVFTLILAFCLAFLPSCTMIEKAGQADILLKDFISALESGDYETAMTFVHPDADVTAEGLEKIVSDIKEQHNVDVSAGITMKERTQLYTRSNLSFSGETAYQHEIAYTIEIEGKTLDLESVVYEDSNGMGVIYFVIKASAGF